MKKVVPPAGVRERWIGLPQGEREFLQSLMSLTRSAKRSRNAEVARAARQWEGVLAFRIRITLLKGRSAGISDRGLRIADSPNSNRQ